MHYTTLVTCLFLMSTTGWARYSLDQDYMAGGNFFDQFTFWDTSDPTDGCVAYGNHQDLYSVSGGNAVMNVSTEQSTPSGRPSIRITSKAVYQSGLFILDLEHMPGSICGTWPAFWLVGPDWPNNGEIDIIEGVNDQTSNAMTLHTGPGCSISQSKSMAGKIQTDNCDINASGQAQNAGCSIHASSSNTYGDGFNGAGGGTYATEFSSSAITIWFWSGQAPADVLGDSPDPSGWGEPLATFSGGCDISSAFKNQQIVFDTTFCGQWAGQVWPGSSCAASTKAATCDDYVLNHGSDFADAFWSIRSLKVYQGGAGGSGGQSSAPSHSPPSATGQPHGHSTMATVPSSPASGSPPSGPSHAPPAGSSPAWPKPSAPSQAPPPSQAPAPSIPGAQSGSAPASPSQTWGGGGAPWGEQPNSSGAWNVGQPAFQTKHHHGGNKVAQPTNTANANNDSSSGTTAGLHSDNGAYDVSIPSGEARIRRHLRHHKRHFAGRL